MRAARPPLVPCRGEPASSAIEPLVQRTELLRIGIRPRDVRDEKAGIDQPLVEVAEIAGDGGRDVLVLRQEAEKPQTRVVHIVPGGGFRGDSRR